MRDAAGIQGDRDRPRRRGAHDRDTARVQPPAAELGEDLASGPVIPDGVTTTLAAPKARAW